MDAVFPVSVKSRDRPSLSGATPHLAPSTLQLLHNHAKLPCTASPRGSSTAISPEFLEALYGVGVLGVLKCADMPDAS